MHPEPATNSSPRPLSDIAQQVAECYAIVHPERPSRSKAMKWINRARKLSTGARGFVSAEMTQAVEELVAAGLLAPSISGERGVAAQGPGAMFGTITRFCEGAVVRGTAAALLAGLDDEIYRPSWGRAPELPEHLEQHVRLALLSDAFSRYEDVPLPSHIWLWLAEPRAKRYLARLPEQHRLSACVVGLSTLAHHFRPIDEFARSCEELVPGPVPTLLIARARTFQGRFTEAREAIAVAAAHPALDKHSRMECEALRAVLALLHGEDEVARVAIASAVEIERDGSRKRILYPSCASVTIALPALVRLGTPESRALFTSLLEARRKLKIQSELDAWLLAADTADAPYANVLPLYARDAASMTQVFLAIASRWHRQSHLRRDDASCIDLLETLVRQADTGGYAWVVAEIQAVLEAAVSRPERLSDDVRALLAARTAAERHAELGSHTLIPLIRPVEPWEHALRQLEQLAVAARPTPPASPATGGANAKRLVWQVEDNPYEESVVVTPLEQTRQKNGRWTNGRRVALKRLLEQNAELDHLSEQDRKACQTIRRIMPSGWGGGSPSYRIDERTVHRLSGHPLVIDLDGEPVEVVEAVPEIRVERTKDSLCLEIHPRWTGRHYQSTFDPLDRRVEVTHFTAAHRRIAEAVPAGGLRLPASASRRLDELLGGLSADIAVHGDGGGAPDAPLQPGDPDTVLVLEPAGDGLRVRLRVEPVTGSGSFFDAGEGGAVVYVRTAEGSVAVRRDLAAERARVQGLVERCDVLAARFDGRPQMTLDDAGTALELLDDVQRDGLRCVWPGEIPFRLKARADVRQLSLQVTAAKEWFAADGELAIGDDHAIALTRLLRLMHERPGSRFVEIGPGEFLALSTTLKQQLDTLQAFSQPAPKHEDPQRTHPMALLALDELIEHATIKANASWKRLRQRVTEASAIEPAVPGALEAELRGYQRDGFAWLSRLARVGAGACLADDMGLGKTVQTLALLLSRADGGAQLVVAPTSVTGNWFAEAQRFAPSLVLHDYAAAGAGASERRAALLESLGPFDLVVASYGLLVSDTERLTGVHWHSVVLDEAQAIKNAATRRAKSARALVADCRVVTTGTPVQNDLMDLHSLFAFLNPRLLGSQAAFRKRFAVPITRDDDVHARTQLQRLVSPFLLRRHKRDVLRELPARTELTLEVSLSDDEATLYEALRRDALDALESGGHSDEDDAPKKFEVLAHLTRLRRLCCHPSLVAPDWTGPASKLALFVETLDELVASGHKALVFSQFVDNLKLVEQALQERSISYQYIDGSVSAAQRTARVNAFQGGDGNAFLISLTAGGTGLNLTAADYVIHLDPWWNPAVEDQASDRAHRLGQQRPVTIVRMVTRGTIEQRIQALHGTKRELADSVLAGAGASALDLETMLSLLNVE